MRTLVWLFMVAADGVTVRMTTQQVRERREPPGVHLIRDRCGGPTYVGRDDAGVEWWHVHGDATPEGFAALEDAGFEVWRRP